MVPTCDCESHWTASPAEKPAPLQHHNVGYTPRPRNISRKLPPVAANTECIRLNGSAKWRSRWRTESPPYMCPRIAPKSRPCLGPAPLPRQKSSKRTPHSVIRPRTLWLFSEQRVVSGRWSPDFQQSGEGDEAPLRFPALSGLIADILVVSSRKMHITRGGFVRLVRDTHKLRSGVEATYVRPRDRGGEFTDSQDQFLLPGERTAVSRTKGNVINNLWRGCGQGRAIAASLGSDKLKLFIFSVCIVHSELNAK